jgi:CheY-like chemotaxis protein
MERARNGRRVLVVDDDPLAREIYKAVLGSAGFDIVLAAEGAAGLARYGEGGFHCVVLDIQMPGLSGLELLERIAPAVSGVPVVAISGSSDADPAGPLHRAEALGAARVFTKGFEHDDLVAAVRALTGA